MPDLTAIADTLLTNFLTVRFRPWEASLILQMECLPHEVRERCLAIGIRSEMFQMRYHRQNLVHGLLLAGYHELLDRIEVDPDHGWRVHLFLVDDRAVDLLCDITDGKISPGEPVRFDPVAFVQRRIRLIERVYRRTGRWDWRISAFDELES
jgi:hypothetical protein